MRVESNYKQVAKQIRAFDVDLAKKTTKELRALSITAVGAARQEASWSRQIPSLIKPTVTQAGAGIRVAAKPTPVGVLNERKRGEWRHPVFGNKDVWVTQRARASVRPVLEKIGPQLKEAGERAIGEAKREAGI